MFGRKRRGELSEPATPRAGWTSRIAGMHSVAVLTGLIFMPLVVGAGFLPHHGQPDPASVDFSATGLRGSIDPFRDGHVVRSIQP